MAQLVFILLSEARTYENVFASKELALSAIKSTYSRCRVTATEQDTRTAVRVRLPTGGIVETFTIVEVVPVAGNITLG